jgi:hypothetical protein
MDIPYGAILLSTPSANFTKGNSRIIILEPNQFIWYQSIYE